ncbi:ComEC family competence protein [Rhodobacterales bacterium]|nr:ComEC family competence protein [Rhodobacterales bacterium]
MVLIEVSVRFAAPRAPSHGCAVLSQGLVRRKTSNASGKPILVSPRFLSKHRKSPTALATGFLPGKSGRKGCSDLRRSAGVAMIGSGSGRTSSSENGAPLGPGDISLAPETSTSRLSERIPRNRPGSSTVNRFWKELKKPVAVGDDESEAFWDRQGLLWLGFFFAGGIASYASLPAEPAWSVLLAVSILLAAIAFRIGRRVAIGRPFLLLVAFICGVTAGAVRTAAIDAPRIAEAMNATVTGRVETVERSGSGQRLLLEVEAANEDVVSIDRFPKRVRIRVPGKDTVRIGDLVRVRGRLFPPPGPVSPGGYDFSFRAYYNQIGATGFAFGRVEVLDGEPIGVFRRAARFVQDIRGEIAERIERNLPDRSEAALAVALLVGDRSGISDQQEEDLRAAGLAHILAISGLHMALFAGGAFSACLLLLALVPAFALRWPIHKWAALAALAAASVYLILSGGAVATQRSYLMISLVFLGVLFGRRGLSLRSVALAGLFLLVLAPERLFFPGFQMSFAAVICLVAVYDLWRQRERLAFRREAPQGPALRVARHLLGWSIGLTVTAVVAGVATGIVGAHHFARIAPYGLVGNLLGMPVFSLLVMPMGVLALVLMPFGLAALPLHIMAVGLSFLLDIAHFTAELGEGAGAVGRVGAGAAVLLVTALFTGLLIPGRLRLTALVPLAAGLSLVSMSRPPDIQIASAGSRLAARDDEGSLRYSGRAGSFVTDIWLQDDGISLDEIKSRKMKSPQIRCDEAGCVVNAYEATGRGDDSFPVRIAAPKVPEAFSIDCRHADIIVSDIVAPASCGAALILDARRRANRGAVSIWLGQSGDAQTTTDHSQNQTGDRVESKVIDIGARPDAPRLVRIQYAVPDPPRPWHRPGDFTRNDLPKARRQPPSGRSRE